MSGFRGNDRSSYGHGGGSRLGSPGAPRTDSEPERGQIKVLLAPPNPKPAYFLSNDPKAVRPELLGKEAEAVAEKLAKVPASQLRRFYAEVMALKRRAELTQISDGEIQAQLTLLRAKAAYTWQRQAKYPGELVAFFNRHAHGVQTRLDFLRGFQPHFEAVMAFHKVFEIKKGADS